MIDSRLCSAQQARTRARKQVDRRASKGRKIRYTVQPKLVNFMVPRASEQQYDQHLTEELFSTLFGGRTLETAPPPAASAAAAIAPVRLSQTLV
jgi:protein AATF/BFR2